jgi:hypothetical protein
MAYCQNSRSDAILLTVGFNPHYSPREKWVSLFAYYVFEVSMQNL